MRGGGDGCLLFLRNFPSRKHFSFPKKIPRSLTQIARNVQGVTVSAATPTHPGFPSPPFPPKKRGIKGFKILSILTPSKVLCENAAEATGWVGGRALEKKPGIIQGGFKFRGPPTHIFPGGEKRWEIPLSRIWVTRGR